MGVASSCPCLNSRPFRWRGVGVVAVVGVRANGAGATAWYRWSRLCCRCRLKSRRCVRSVRVGTVVIGQAIAIGSIGAGAVGFGALQLSMLELLV